MTNDAILYYSNDILLYKMYCVVNCPSRFAKLYSLKDFTVYEKLKTNDTSLF